MLLKLLNAGSFVPRTGHVYATIKRLQDACQLSRELKLKLRLRLMLKI